LAEAISAGAEPALIAVTARHANASRQLRFTLPASPSDRDLESENRFSDKLRGKSDG